MRALWRYIQGKDNRELLTFVCGGLAAIVTAGWVAYTHFSKKEPQDRQQTTISAPGGIAAGSITGSPITLNPQTPAVGPSNPLQPSVMPR
ncbi:MAG TPA: hypothetical protein VGC80_08430 [Acetobacteraceae bacterium]|jgi:hypothetical protein